MLSVNVIAGAQCDLDTTLITVGEQRNLRGTQYGGGNHVGVGTVYIDFIYRTLGGYICQSQAIAVAVGLFRQIQHGNVLYLDIPLHMGNCVTSGNIGIHTVSTDVFADLIHYKNIYIVKIDFAQTFFGSPQEVRLFVQNLFNEHTLDETGLVKSVLAQCKSGQYLRIIENLLGNDRKHFTKLIETVPVYGFCSLLLAHTDDCHLTHTALVRAAECSVSLDTAAQDNTVCLICIFVHIDRLSIVQSANFHGIHGGLDGAAQEIFGYTIAGEDLHLSFCGCTAMASHGREYEGFCATIFNKINDCLCNDRNICHTAAAAGDGNMHSRTDALPQFRSIQLLIYDTGNLFHCIMTVVKQLFNLYHFGKGLCGCQAGYHIPLFFCL